MPSFLDIHLKQIAEIVKRRTGRTEQTLLFHRGRLCIPLSHDNAAKRRLIFSGNILPCRFAHVIAEAPFLLRML